MKTYAQYLHSLETKVSKILQDHRYSQDGVRVATIRGLEFAKSLKPSETIDNLKSDVSILIKDIIEIRNLNHLY
jgi:hypothetical protein